MARVTKIRKRRTAPANLSVSHRNRLIEELRTNPELAAEYLAAAAEDDDTRIYAAATRTVAAARGSGVLGRYLLAGLWHSYGVLRPK